MKIVHVLGSGRVELGGELVRGLDLGFTNPVGTGGVCLCLGCGYVGGLEEKWVSALASVWEGVVRGIMSLNYLCRWQVQVSVYCVMRISANLRCIQCSILLHLINI